MPVVRVDTSASDVGRVVPCTNSPHARSVGHLDAPASQYTHSQTSRKSAHFKSLSSDEARGVGSALGLQMALPHIYDVWNGCKHPGPRVCQTESTRPAQSLHGPFRRTDSAIGQVYAFASIAPVHSPYTALQVFKRRVQRTQQSLNGSDASSEGLRDQDVGWAASPAGW